MTGSILAQGLGTFGGGFLITQGFASNSAPPVVITIIDGGFDEREYQAYRKYLDKLTKATTTKDRAKAVEAAKELQSLDLETPELDKLLDGPVLEGTLRLAPVINFENLAKDMELIKAYLDRIALQWANIMEADDEAAFLMMVQ